MSGFGDHLAGLSDHVDRNAHAIVAVCWIIGLSGRLIARAAVRWLHVAAVRRTLLWLAGLAVAVTVALTIGPLWSLVVLTAWGVLLLMLRERRPL